ncbi:unnamed protein product [Heterotrigona itama]|uniref:Protein krueppel n=1 Tax=Heterotrigona itama TaxID=395501 RepID=A0A6V7H1W2_9HYME|nr:unnamed protein product [Heterotrigona itama]
MELGKDEAQICRLCGQYESIYIDVFGEEGTKRFLGLKIHTKINILIDERDPLPKAICVQCLGKLEFVCDFQEECLRTQQVLRDRYNLPPLTEIAEVKTEDTPSAPSTSTNNSNNETNKNLNSSNDENIKEVEQRVLRTATKAQRNLRSQQQVRDSEEATNDQNSVQSTTEDNIENVQIVQNSETTPTRWLRSRQSTETIVINDATIDIPIANRLRSHDNTATEITVNTCNNSNENDDKPIGKQQDPHTIQIPTSALNKLLSIVSNSPNIEVSVKESRNQTSDIEDISFTVELCKKESDDVATVRARVFPDQGSCLVDKAIVGLLQNQSCVEVNSIINTIINSSLKNGNSTKLKDSAEFEQKWQASQNPEELFRIDGEEIRVDDNVEHIVTDNQNGYSCKLCCKFYERKDKCMVHVKTHLGIKQYTCILCNAKFVCKSDVMKHIRCSHTNPRPIQCPKCPKRFKSKFYLMEHDNVHKGVRPYSCTDCGQSYHHKVSLQIHMKSHLPPQNLACEYCGKVFPYRTRLLSHIASVKENDGLPQIVCMRCLGTLEFLCDFYERCHLVQKGFSKASQNTRDEKFQGDSDVESDKENTVPSKNGTKWKVKVSSPDDLKSTKNCLSENNTYKTERKEKSVNLVDNNSTTNNYSVTQTTVQLSNVTSYKEMPGNDQHNVGNLKHRNLKNNIVKKPAIRTNLTNKSLQKNEKNIRIKSGQPAQCKRGRKSKFEKMRERIRNDCFFKVCYKTDLTKKNDNFDNNRKNKNLHDECKRSCLPAIYDNDNSNNVINNVMTLPSQIDAEQLIDTPLNTDFTKSNEAHIVIDKSLEIKSNNESMEKPGNCLNNTEDCSVKCKAISIISKEVKGETEDTSPFKQNENLMKDQSLLAKESKKTEDSETNLITVPDSNSDIEIISVHNNQQSEYSEIFKEKNRMVVIKSFSNKVSNPKTIQKDCTEVCIGLDIIDQNTKNEECNVLNKRSLSRLSQDSFSGTKNKNKPFGKISKLISDEQKQIIETYYVVNMSTINSEEVQKNITVIDKKNIRCNICGSLYFRMDKCQVHIWGHLQMKPYQCKACDFATVTVSNVRCHIRKSHLKIKPFACHLCEKRYVTAVLLEEHINTHTGARPYKCELCDFASSSRQTLNYHSATHKPLKDVSCKICGKEFYSKTRLRAHMIVHNKDKAVMCKLCSAYLSNAEALEMHHKNIHMQDYVCNVCGKRVKSRKALYNHQNVHAAAKYKCTLCPNVYKSSQILKEHLLKHEGIRKYKCNVCEKSFGQQSHLAAHMAVHSKIRFHCPGCSKPFNRLDNMKMHTKRCKPFLTNPDLKRLLNKRERTISFDNVAELTAELKTGNMTNSVSSISVQNQNGDISVKTEEETVLNLCKLGLNISPIETTDETCNSDKKYNEKEVTKSADINVVKIANTNDRLIPENENLPVFENILGPENY